MIIISKFFVLKIRWLMGMTRIKVLAGLFLYTNSALPLTHRKKKKSEKRKPAY